MMSAAAVAADDPAGWSAAKWGMSDAEILHAIPAATRLDPPEKVGMSAEQSAQLAKLRNDLRRMRGQPELPAEPVHGNQVLAHVAVPVELARTKFRALMVPDQAGRLASVLLSPIHQTDATVALFESLEQLLVQKYGRPWTTRDGDSAEIQWTIKTTVITLTRWHSPMTGTLHVSIQYKRKSADLDKM